MTRSATPSRRQHKQTHTTPTTYNSIAQHLAVAFTIGSYLIMIFHRNNGADERIEMSKTVLQCWLISLASLFLLELLELPTSFSTLSCLGLAPRIRRLYRRGESSHLEEVVFRSTLAVLCFIVTSSEPMLEMPLNLAKPPHFHLKLVVDLLLTLGVSSSSTFLFVTRWLIRLCALTLPMSGRIDDRICRVATLVAAILVLLHVSITAQIWTGSGPHHESHLWLILLLTGLAPSQNKFNLPAIIFFNLSHVYMFPGFWKIWYAGADYFLDASATKLLVEGKRSVSFDCVDLLFDTSNCLASYCSAHMLNMCFTFFPHCITFFQKL